MDEVVITSMKINIFRVNVGINEWKKRCVVYVRCESSDMDLEYSIQMKYETIKDMTLGELEQWMIKKIGQ